MADEEGGEGAVVVGRGEKLPLADQTEVGVTAEEVLDLAVVLVGLDGAGGVDEASGGGDERRADGGGSRRDGGGG